MMPQLMPTVQFDADRGDAGRRLDRAIIRRVRDVAGLSRNRAQEWITSGAVSVDGTVVLKAASRLRPGSTVTIHLPALTPLRARPAAEAAPLEILFEDEAVLAVNKPPGVVVHPSYRNPSGTLLNAILAHTASRPVPASPGIVTRLDRGTSGLVLVALDGTCHRRIQRDAAHGLVRKEYLAVVQGMPRPGRHVVTLPLHRDPADRRRVRVGSGGAVCETRYERIATRAGRSLVRCELVTGRMHQIRVHLAASGYPIFGDRTYGTPHPTLTRQALHAWRVTLPHPLTREVLTVTAPLPPDLLDAFPEWREAATAAL